MLWQWIYSYWLRFHSWWSNKITVALPLKVVQGDYPATTRYISENDEANRFIVVVETLPGNRMVLFGHAGNGRPVCLYFPYVYFVVRYMKAYWGPNETKYVFADLHVGFSPNQLTTMRGRVGSLPLSNYNGMHQFCLGTQHPRGVYDTVREVAEAAINCFWKTAFQMDRSDVREWAYHTKAGSGEPYMDGLVVGKAALAELVGCDRNDHLSNYHSQPEPKNERKKPKRKGRDKSSRGKKRKNSSRET